MPSLLNDFEALILVVVGAIVGVVYIGSTILSVNSVVVVVDAVAGAVAVFNDSMISEIMVGVAVAVTIAIAGGVVSRFY